MMLRSRSGSSCDLERQLAVLRLVPERPGHDVEQVGEEDLLGIDRDGAGLDLRQVEDVADEVQQVGAGAVDGARELDLLRASGCRRGCRRAAGRGSGCCSAACAARATCWRGTRTCTSRSAPARSAFSSSARRACSISWFLRSTSTLRSASCCAFCSSCSLVCCSSRCCVCSSAASCCDCSSSAFGLHRRFDQFSTMPMLAVSCSRKADLQRR